MLCYEIRHTVLWDQSLAYFTYQTYILTAAMSYWQGFGADIRDESGADGGHFGAVARLGYVRGGHCQSGLCATVVPCRSGVPLCRGVGSPVLQTMPAPWHTPRGQLLQTLITNSFIRTFIHARCRRRGPISHNAGSTGGKQGGNGERHPMLRKTPSSGETWPGRCFWVSSGAHHLALESDRHSVSTSLCTGPGSGRVGAASSEPGASAAAGLPPGVAARTPSGGVPVTGTACNGG